ncbi:hypothetical protein AVEN_157696-1 [Araneus ventricosus]|uniref:Ion transport domain-containing protein n=1 Tax=Araneus ventricosus TaxID=182803 RepID=A0A4Y2JVV4_ARAVE|nr:hypothetical protein AVEN_157696-1 [Araneus ventricosus]
MMCILFNCITLGMYQPCADEVCTSSRCRLLEMFDDFIFAFFAIEMMIKTIAMGIKGKGSYMSDSWNRLDCFIVFAGSMMAKFWHWLKAVLHRRLNMPAGLIDIKSYGGKRPPFEVWREEYRLKSRSRHLNMAQYYD